jgi:hypothetical protein
MTSGTKTKATGNKMLADPTSAPTTASAPLGASVPNAGKAPCA